MAKEIQASGSWLPWLALLVAGGVVLGFLLLRPDNDVGKTARAPGLPPTEPERFDAIGVRSLLEEMVDLSRLSRTPEPPYTAHLASSYDRRSTDPTGADWFANEDWVSATRPNYFGVEESGLHREYVLLDVKGPGAIVRLWTATPTGILRVYLDGHEAPDLEEPLGELLSGQGIIPEPFAYVAARGYDLYFPIPYRDACKVTIDEIIATDPFRGGPLPKFYYQINYRTYPDVARDRLRTFTRAEVDRARPTLDRVAAVLADPATNFRPLPAAPSTRLERADTELRANLEIPGGGVVRKIALRPAGGLHDPILTEATLLMSFDSELTVEVPLGRFFGSGIGKSAAMAPYESLPFTVAGDGTLISRWPLPFRKQMTVAITNAPGLRGEVWAESLPWTDESLYFYAVWHPPEAFPTRPFRDLALVAVEGTGVFVGTLLNLVNPPGARWWGEGDEKVYVDHETFPSIFGTGTEDYFGYAWSTPERFVRPFHAQTLAEGPGFDGMFSMNRYHVIDAIPFTRALRFDLELWHWDDTSVAWSTVAYLYAKPGARRR